MSTIFSGALHVSAECRYPGCDHPDCIDHPVRQDGFRSDAQADLIRDLATHGRCDIIGCFAPKGHKGPHRGVSSD